MTCQTTDALALKLDPSIEGDAISPDCPHTDRTRSALAQREQGIASRIAGPEGIAGLAVFLAREEAGYITGETTNANGGIYRQ
jgi:NAD(P)-dependent dehydrogenase (short-subunit alcohol dehydrogenase family)